MWKPAALPIGAFLATAIWGAAAMVPFAPASEEMMFWIPVSIALTSAAAALVVAMMQDIILVAVKRWPLFVKFYPTLCLEPLPFAFLPIVLSLAGIAEFGPAMLSAALLLIGFSFAETLFAAALHRARATPTAVVISMQCAALVFAVYMYKKGIQANVSDISWPWFASSVTAMSLFSFLVGRYWANLLRDAEVGFSPLLKWVLVTFIAEGSTSEWSRWRLKQPIKQRRPPGLRSKPRRK